MLCRFTRIDPTHVRCLRCQRTLETTVEPTLCRAECKGLFPEEKASPYCQWQAVVGQSPSECSSGGIRYRCANCGFLTDPLQGQVLPDNLRLCPVPGTGRLAVPVPTGFKQYANFATDLAKHIALGSPASTREEILESFRICSSCPLYSDLTGQCGECGCYVNLALHNENLNKLAWADQACPKEYWKAPLERRKQKQ